MQLRFYHALGSRRIGGFLAIPKGLFGYGLSGFLLEVSPAGIPIAGECSNPGRAVLTEFALHRISLP